MKILNEVKNLDQGHSNLRGKVGTKKLTFMIRSETPANVSEFLFCTDF